jgi:hypothetical protein
MCEYKIKNVRKDKSEYLELPDILLNTHKLARDLSKIFYFSISYDFLFTENSKKITTLHKADIGSNVSFRCICVFRNRHKIYPKIITTTYHINTLQLCQ